jgi:hypothetical protein
MCQVYWQASANSTWRERMLCRGRNLKTLLLLLALRFLLTIGGPALFVTILFLLGRFAVSEFLIVLSFF